MKTEIKCPLCGDIMVRPQISPGCLTHQHQMRCPFVWNDLTEEQMEVLHDAALGRAVRKMKLGEIHADGGMFAVMDIKEGWSGWCRTPEKALKKVGLMEVKK